MAIYKRKTMFYILMNEHGYTLASLAEATGCAQRTIEAISMGKTDPAKIQARLFLAIAKAWDMDPYELMEMIRFQEVEG